MSLFNATEIYQFAIRIEENGEKFYRDMSQTMEDRKVKNLFTYLADEEAKHKKIFEEMVSKIEKYEPLESYPSEYFAYLRAYADNTIFEKERLDKEMAKLKDIISALEFGIRRELDSILYFQEMKNFVPEQQHSLIDRIIEEERSHFLDLSGIKKLYQT